MKRLSLAAASLLAVAAAPAAAETPERIADPRPRSAVVDTTGTLTTTDVATIDSLAQRARAGGELVVVVIDSVSGAVPRQFTTQLFNHWRLDTRERNRGVLLLAALKDRKAEIVVGDGYPTTATQVTDSIMREVIVARFKARRPREAMVEGAQALVERLILSGPKAPVRAAEQPLVPALGPEATPQPPPLPTTSPGPVEQATSIAVENPLPVTGGVGGALLGGAALMRRYLRRRPRTCPACAATMTRLDEATDDAHLSSGEKTEERVGSVDYDIWACPGCRHTLKLRYGALFTSYARCPECRSKTLKSETTTMQSATTSSTGLARVDETCAHCNHRRSYTRTIPRVQESSSRSSSSSRSGGSSSGRGSSGSW